MQPLFRLFLDICLLRRGPQDVPASVALFILVLIIGLVIDVLSVIYDAGFPMAVLVALVINGVMLLAVMALLWLLGFAARWLQTLTAMLGTSVIINILQLPVILLININPAGIGIFGFILLFLLIWYLVITMHIFRHALSIQVFPAGVLAVGYLMLNKALFELLLPQAG